MPDFSPEFWSDRVEEALDGYAQELLRSVAYRLLRHRSQWPADELVERIRGTIGNAATIDRRLKEFDPAGRKLLAMIGLSRRPRWPIGHLLSMLGALGHADGIAPVLALLEESMLFPARAKSTPKLKSFEQWLGSENVAGLEVFAHPRVTARVRGEDLQLPELPAGKAARGEPREADGLEWPLRLALIWQQVDEAPIKRTMQLDFFKRDLQRLADDALLNAPFAESPWPIPDTGPLAVLWATACGMLLQDGAELKAGKLPAEWASGLPAVVEQLWLTLAQLDNWDPDHGWLPVRETANPFPSVYLLLLLLLHRQPSDRWLHADDIGNWLLTHHPYWRESTGDSVSAWLHVVLFGLMFQLKLLQLAPGADGVLLLRLSTFGRWLASGNGSPPNIPDFPQTLMVQSNFEILAYRQGLKPAVIADLTKFARWKSFGAACQLELIADRVYRGLEAGMTYDSICQVLQQHGIRPLPDNVAEALKTWANKRERIVVYPDAAMLEFETPAELDVAIARGLVEAKVTGRIGLVRNEDALDYRQLRLTGTRDFAARPDRCLQMQDDGITMSVDAARSDLLLETELAQVAVPLNGVATGRTYRFTRESLHKALDRGATMSSLDEWLTVRSGAPLSAAARLLATGNDHAVFQVDRCIVLKSPTAELADGLMQLPATRGLIRERLGPQALLVAEDDLPRLREQIESLGQKLELLGG